MKYFALISSLLIVFLMLGCLGILGIGSLIVLQANAYEYSPLDFLSDYDKFEVIVGIDKHNGRYCTYHYEFKE